MNNLDGPPTLLRNVSANTHHWIEFRLVGAGKSNRDAIGARVSVSSGGLHQRGDVLCGGSFASSSDPRLFFGLGDSSKVDAVEIMWPDHSRQSFPDLSVDRIYIISEADKSVRVQPTSK